MRAEYQRAAYYIGLGKGVSGVENWSWESQIYLDCQRGLPAFLFWTGVGVLGVQNWSQELNIYWNDRIWIESFLPRVIFANN